MAQEKELPKVYMVFQDEATKKTFYDSIKRVRAQLGALQAYHIALDDVDEDAPDFMTKLEPLLTRLTLTLYANYPGGGGQYDFDLAMLDNVIT